MYVAISELAGFVDEGDYRHRLTVCQENKNVKSHQYHSGYTGANPEDHNNERIEFIHQRPNLLVNFRNLRS